MKNKNEYQDALKDFKETMRRNPHYGGAGGFLLGTRLSIEKALIIADKLQSGYVSKEMADWRGTGSCDQNQVDAYKAMSAKLIKEVRDEK